MNLKKMWKRFWTMDVHNHEGFTLVELIIVIAILAILSGVAVVGYSTYVKKANMQADKTLIAEIENALLLAYYNGKLTSGDYVVIKFDQDAEGKQGSTTIDAAMEAAYGERWKETLRLKYNGWTNTKGDIKIAISGSNFADANGNVNMELLGAVDNLTGQLSGVMEGGALNLENVPGYQQFLADNGIDPADTQLAANAAVLYLAQSSMASENRADVAEMLADPNTWGWDGTFDLENNFLKPVTVGADAKCTEFEALAMVYATMQGYCMQKDSENGNTEWADKFAAIDLSTQSDGVTPVDDEIAVLTKLCEEFTAMVDADDRDAFNDYLYDNAQKDIEAYYGVIDGISENQDTFLEKLDDSTNFYASQQGLLQAYWDLEINSGEVAVILIEENGAPQILIIGLSE